MLIEITKEDIEKGIPGDKCACPVALAILRAGDFWNISVGSEEMIVNNTKHTAPTIVKIFVWRFDRGAAVEPFKFVLANF